VRTWADSPLFKAFQFWCKLPINGGRHKTPEQQKWQKRQFCVIFLRRHFFSQKARQDRMQVSQAVWAVVALVALTLTGTGAPLRAETPAISAAEQADAPPEMRDEAEIAAPGPARPGRGPVTNLPLPRFVSLKGSEGNARRGPSLSHRIDWVFTHPGMPLKITAEFGHWRRVEDRDGAGGWVHYSLLSGVRNVIIEEDMTELHSRADMASGVVAVAEAGAVMRLGACEGAWCEVAQDGVEGWTQKTGLWGVFPEETRD
jgi:SH3-like domain-containing protein